MVKYKTAYKRALTKSLVKWRNVIKRKEALFVVTNVPCALCDFHDEYTSFPACNDCILNTSNGSCSSFWRIDKALASIEEEAYKIVDTLTKAKNSL